MNLSQKKLKQIWIDIADGIASVDVDQEDRERMARAVGLKLDGQPYFKRDLFVLLASDPLVPCAGPDGDGCPHGRVIRIAMHWSEASDGRSVQWKQRAPYGCVWCVTCGAERHIPGYREAVEARP